MLKVCILRHTEDPDSLVALAAKLCYSPSTLDVLMGRLNSGDIEAFIGMLHEMGHESPFEHASFTFGIEHVSRITEQHLTRHRLASFSIQSGRYVNRSGGRMVIPPEILSNNRLRGRFEESFNLALDVYLETVEVKTEEYIEAMLHQVPSLVEKLHVMVAFNEDFDLTMTERLRTYMPDTYKKFKLKAERKAIEDARYILPNGMETIIVMTMNVRELFHFLNVRHCKRAQWETRKVATAILQLCKQVAPVLFQKAGARCLEGQCPERSFTCGTPYRKEDIFNDQETMSI